MKIKAYPFQVDANKNKYVSVVEGWDTVGLCNETASTSTTSLTNASATEMAYKFCFCSSSKNEFLRDFWGQGNYHYFFHLVISYQLQRDWQGILMPLLWAYLSIFHLTLVLP